MHERVLIRVVGPNFAASLVTDGITVLEAAPILRWTLGKRWEAVRTYYWRKKGFVVERIGPA